MSQAAKQIVTIILVVLLFAALGFAFVTLQGKEKLTNEKKFLQKQLDEYQAREKTTLTENKNLIDKLAAVEKEKNDLLAKVNNVGGNVEEMSAKVNDLTRERDELKKRFDTLQTERDDLALKLDEKGKALAEVATKNAQSATGVEGADPNVYAEVGEAQPSGDDEDYWAKILKEKTALQMELDKIKEDLSNSALEVSDLKKQNSDLQLEISKLQTDKEQIAREIKYGNDLAKNLSIELARAQNEKQFMAGQMEKISEESNNIHQQLKDLSATKVALEKSIVKVQGAKKQVEGKLMETEGVIQGRIEQIYQLKDSLEKDFRPSVKNPRTGEIELAPIIVNGNAPNASEVQAPPPGFKATIVSINSENNFVIVNLGEESGVKTGDKLNVYRGSDYIAGLEVIQVRQDILAADIKNKAMQIEVGDSVR